jgi:hypothetical protein
MREARSSPRAPEALGSSAQTLRIFLVLQSYEEKREQEARTIQMLTRIRAASDGEKYN